MVYDHILTPSRPMVKDRKSDQTIQIVNDCQIILEQISDILYRIKPEGNQKSPFIVHMDKLKPYVVLEMQELNSPDCDITFIGLTVPHPKTRSGREVKHHNGMVYQVELSASLKWAYMF